MLCSGLSPAPQTSHPIFSRNCYKLSRNSTFWSLTWVESQGPILLLKITILSFHHFSKAKCLQTVSGFQNTAYTWSMALGQETQIQAMTQCERGRRWGSGMLTEEFRNHDPSHHGMGDATSHSFWGAWPSHQSYPQSMGCDGPDSPICTRKFGIRLLTVVHFPQVQKWLKYSVSAGAPKPFWVYK